MKKDMVIPNGNYEIHKNDYIQMVITQTIIIALPTLGLCAILIYVTLGTKNEMLGIATSALVVFSIIGGILALGQRIKDKNWTMIRTKYFDEHCQPRICSLEHEHNFIDTLEDIKHYIEYKIWSVTEHDFDCENPNCKSCSKKYKIIRQLNKIGKHDDNDNDRI